MAIDKRTWIAGGLAAGVWFTLSGVVLGHLVYGAEYVEGYRRHLAAAPSGFTILKNILIRLGFGLLGAYLYAAFRPRFGPGPRTALRAGAVLWLAAYLPLAITLVEFGILGGWRLEIGLPWTLAEAMIGCLIAGRIYREA